MAILVLTGDLGQNYQAIDSVFALDSNTAGFFSGVNADKAFEAVKEQLRKKCAALGGDAVINCKFDHRIALDGKKQSLEFFAYGTVVKIVT